MPKPIHIKPTSEKNPARIPSAEITEPRCHVCTSKYRKAIERMIVLGTSHSEISRVFEGDIDRRSISSHAKKHLNHEDGAIRRIIEKQAQDAQEDIESGIQGALRRRAYLELALHKAYEALLDGDVVIEAKDAVNIIQLQDKLDMQSSGAALAEYERHLNAFVKAIREICPPEMHNLILERTRELIGVITIDGTVAEEPKQLNN